MRGALRCPLRHRGARYQRDKVSDADADAVTVGAVPAGAVATGAGQLGQDNATAGSTPAARQQFDGSANPDAPVSMSKGGGSF